MVKYHRCTDEDYKEFYPIQKQSAATLQSLKTDPLRGMFCIDWNDEELPIKILGDESEDNYLRLEALLLPCNYIHTEFGYNEDTVHPECVPDLED